MAKTIKSAVNQYTCSCQRELIYKHQIIDHLKLGATHNIRKISLKSSINFDYSILNQIANITKIQIHIQDSSNQLIQTITQNTSIIIKKLSNIINLFRNIIIDPPKANQVKKFEIINTFKANLPLYTALTQHFEQQHLAQSPIGAIARNIKNQVIDIRRKYVEPMHCFAVFNDEKRIVTGGNDGAIRMWNLETNSQIWFLLKHKAQINSLALGNAEDLVLTGSFDATVRLWNVKLKFQIYKFVGHTLNVSSVLFSQDQSTGFSGSYDKTIRSWDLKLLAPQRIVTFKFKILVICLIREEKLIVACGEKGSVSFFNFKDNKHSNAQTHKKFSLTSIRFTSNEEQFITGSKDGTVEVCVTNGLKRHFFQKKHKAQISGIQISTCSKIFATGSYDSTVIVCDLIKLHTLRLIQYRSSITSLYFLKKSSSILICSMMDINWLSLSTYVNQEKIKIKVSFSIAISHDLKYAAFGFFCVCLIDIEKKSRVEKSSKINQVINCLGFSSNSAFVAAGCFGGEITILSISKLVQLRTLNTKLSSIGCLSFSKSNELIGFSDCDTSVNIISIKKKNYFMKLKEK